MPKRERPDNGKANSAGGRSRFATGALGTLSALQVRRVERPSKSKIAHIIQIRHRDEVGVPITDWLQEAYD